MDDIDIDIEPKSQVLRSLGFSRADFEEALMTALEELDGKPVQEMPPAPNIPLLLHGKKHLLGDLARIVVMWGASHLEITHQPQAGCC